jgi:hypothetical protein
MFRLSIVAFLLFVSFVEKAEACASPGDICTSNEDCCPNLCSPTSCSGGVCIGSTCLSNTSPCQVDCQCCSGACLQTWPNVGRCGVPTKSSPELGRMRKNATATQVLVFRPDCDGAWCSAGDCNVDGQSCDICCPPGQGANCDANSCHCWCSSSLNKDGGAVGSVTISARAENYIYAAFGMTVVIASSALVATGVFVYRTCRGQSSYIDVK